jgi:hypothetical protein
MESNAGRIFGAVEITEQDAQKDWRERPRSEMLERVIVAVDGAKMEAEEVGDENYVRYIDAALFPFLEAELEKALADVEGEVSRTLDVLEPLQSSLRSEDHE